ncbi:MAG: lactate utilization protein C [Betaproteobacteria bacterium]|nr:lactate utilization protein C [Betaproteobacteria bacterium]
MSARENILARIRGAQGKPGAEPTAVDLDRVRAVMAHPVTGPQPAFAHPPDLLVQFLKECDRVGTTHAQVASDEGIPAEVARYLAATGLEPRLVAWPAFAALDWASAGIAIESRPARGDDRTGLTGSTCAIAETGTTLLLSSPEQPKVTALLPETHVCIVRRSRLLGTLEEAFALERREQGELPRSAFFVSGPSRTADIEQTMVIGAHGPYRVHVIIAP